MVGKFKMKCSLELYICRISLEVPTYLPTYLYIFLVLYVHHGLLSQ